MEIEKKDLEEEVEGSGEKHASCDILSTEPGEEKANTTHM